MNVSRQDASDALDAIGTADRRVREFKGNRQASPFLILWGLIWLLANTVVDLFPAHGSRAWNVGLVVGTAGTLLLVVLQARRVACESLLTPVQRKEISRRAAMLGVTIWCYFPAVLTVLSPLTGRQQNAFISLFWAFAYMASGAWLGNRMFIAGAVTAAATLFGYLFLQQHFFLWMAFVGGGSLILAGLWLRKA